MAYATRLSRRDVTRLTRSEPAVRLRTNPELRIRSQFKLPDWFFLASWSFGGLFPAFRQRFASLINRGYTAYKPLMKRRLIAVFFHPSVYIEFRLFVILECRSDDVSSMLWRYERGLSPGRKILLVLNPARSCSATPPCARTRLACGMSGLWNR